MRTLNNGRGVDYVAETQSTDEVLIQLWQRHGWYVVHCCFSSTASSLPAQQRQPHQLVNTYNIVSHSESRTLNL